MCRNEVINGASNGIERRNRARPRIRVQARDLNSLVSDSGSSSRSFGIWKSKRKQKRDRDSRLARIAESGGSKIGSSRETRSLRGPNARWLHGFGQAGNELELALVRSLDECGCDCGTRLSFGVRLASWQVSLVVVVVVVSVAVAVAVVAAVGTVALEPRACDWRPQCANMTTTRALKTAPARMRLANQGSESVSTLAALCTTPNAVACCLQAPRRASALQALPETRRQ